MANGEVETDTVEEICWVHDKIEKLLRYYMTKKEVVYVLSRTIGIEPQLTEIVWKNLEEENKEFFRAYHIRLAINDQIKRFNKLLEIQAKLMSHIQPASSSIPLSNGSQFHSMSNQAPLLAGPSENMDQAIQTMPNVYANGPSSFQPCMQVVGDMSGQAGRTNVPEKNVLVQSLNAEAMQGIINGCVIKSGQNTPQTIFGGDNGLLESGNAFVRGPSMNSSGLLGHGLPKNFSLSDLTDDFFTGVLENHYRYRFPTADANFSDMQIMGQQQDIGNNEYMSDSTPE